jgi:hypothetical protein
MSASSTPVRPSKKRVLANKKQSAKRKGVMYVDKSSNRKRKYKAKSKTNSNHETDARILNLKEARRQKVNDIIAGLNEDECRQLLLQLTEKQPSLILDAMDLKNKQRSPTKSPGPSNGSPDWCVCLHCLEMPTDAEKLCCGKTPEDCISILPVSIFLNMFLYNCILLMGYLY